MFLLQFAFFAAFLAAEETMEKGAAFYIFHSDNYSMWFREALMSTKDLELRETLIWNKDSLCLARQGLPGKEEHCGLCVYRWYGKAECGTQVCGRPRY